VWVGPLAAIVAGVANLVVFAVEKAALGISFILAMQPGAAAAPLPAAIVFVESVIPALVAAVLLALLVKFTARPVLIFQIISAVFLLVSFGTPLAVPADTLTKLGLISLHIVAAVVIVGLLTTLARAKESSR
jgi:hypothetical protein